MRRHNRRDRRQSQPHGDSKCSSFRYLSLIRHILPSPERAFTPETQSTRRDTKTKKRTSRRSLRLGGENSSLNRKQERLLEGFRDPAQKTRGVGAIDQPVIVRE